MALLLTTASLLALTYTLHQLTLSIYNLSPLHPLHAFPGPRLAAATKWYKTYLDLLSPRSFVPTLVNLRAEYDTEVIRAGPNERHFSAPETYHEIYTMGNKWDKEETLYHSFGEDRSSFGFLGWGVARERREIVGRGFSRSRVREGRGSWGKS